ncbi:MAG TPA: hypothetical protein VMH39_00905, partial [Gemmatimonadaceae bacterium]|nr:hypothetical protein [Gemmatimonadaceae bacterium]
MSVLCIASTRGARGLSAASQPTVLPPIREVTQRVAVAAEAFTFVTGVRQLRDGQVIVNDPGGRRLVLLDSSLHETRVLMDSVPAIYRTSGWPYDRQAGAIVAYRGDTTLFVDPIVRRVLVIDPSGTVVRSTTAPRPGDALPIADDAARVGLDGQGRLVYRSDGRAAPNRGSAPVSPAVADAKA